MITAIIKQYIPFLPTVASGILYHNPLPGRLGSLCSALLNNRSMYSFNVLVLFSVSLFRRKCLYIYHINPSIIGHQSLIKRRVSEWQESRFAFYHTVFCQELKVTAFYIPVCCCHFFMRGKRYNNVFLFMPTLSDKL